MIVVNLTRYLLLLNCSISFILLTRQFACASDDHGAHQSVDCDQKTDEHEKAKYQRQVNEELSNVNQVANLSTTSSNWSKFLEARTKALNDYVPCAINDEVLPCECSLDQIDRDLLPWKEMGGISEILIESGKPLGVFYQIIDHKLYRQRDCNFPARCEGIEHFILKVIDKLEDSELVINVRDWSQIINDPRRYHLYGVPLPVFSFSKEPKWYKDITYPAWAFWSGGPAIEPYPIGIGNWGKLRETIARKSEPWSEKVAVAFFRGSRTSSDRDPLILLSRAKPELVDAQYTKNQAWRSLADTLGREPAPTIRFEEQCRYKYLINLRGVAASFRYKHLFMCKSLVLNVESDLMEYFYPLLKPWVHYIPITNDVKELEVMISFLRENDDIAQEIAAAGFQLLWDHLTMDSVACYWRQLLEKYQKMLTYQPKRAKEVIQILHKTK